MIVVSRFFGESDESFLARGVAMASGGKVPDPVFLDTPEGRHGRACFEAVGSFVRHAPTGTVGKVEKVFAPGEHPTATCTVVRLSTGDEFVMAEDAFEELREFEARVFAVLVETFRGVAESTIKMGDATGIRLSTVASLMRSALAAALRSRGA